MVTGDQFDIHPGHPPVGFTRRGAGGISGSKGDERNVILTLARMLLTASTAEMSSKDLAAEWVIPQLPNEHAALLDLARKAYRATQKHVAF